MRRFANTTIYVAVNWNGSLVDDTYLSSRLAVSEFVSTLSLCGRQTPTLPLGLAWLGLAWLGL